MMGIWKFSPFLALGFLVLYHMGILQAAPFRSDLLTKQTTLDTNQPLKENSSSFMKFMKKMLGNRETQDSSITTQKRACNTATCVTNNLVDLLSKYGSLLKQGFLPMKIGQTSFGRRRRDDQK